jgi:hypothetical protein
MAHDKSAFAIAEDLSKILLQEGLKKSTKKEAIAILCSTYGLRTVPIGTSLGGAGPGGSSRPGKASTSEKNTSQQPKSQASYWKNDETVIALSSDRKVAIANLKAASGDSEKSEALAVLRDIEGHLKARKQELKK